MTNAIPIESGELIDAKVAVVSFAISATPQVTTSNVDRNTDPNITVANMSTANDNSSASIITTGVLPVTLSRFTAKEASCGVVDLNWKSASEDGISSYSIEYSTDGRNFSTVKNISAKNVKEGSTYTATVSQQEESGYYRLKMNEVDNTFSYSSAVKVTLNCVAAQIKVYPNPVTEVVYVSSLKGTETITIYSIDGKKMLEQKAIAGENALKIASLTNGSYNLVITNGEEVSNFKLAKN